jgi:xenotropic and polytropic retrovirus receptor 1
MVNAGKYLSTIVLLFIAYFRNTSQGYEALFISVYVFSTIYSYGWDITMDWGLLRGTKPGRGFLRDRLKFPNHFYYFAMVTNLILRFSWLLTLIPLSYLPQTFVEFEGMLFILALAEAYRRA